MSLLTSKAKAPPIENAQTLIQDTMMILLERNERHFEKLLRAQLLQEGCNYPLALAKPRFFQLMLSELLKKTDHVTQEKLNRLISEAISSSSESFPHETFYKAMRLLANTLDNAGKVMALEVINSLQAIIRESQLDPVMFQENSEQFQSRIQTMAEQLWSAGRFPLPDPPPLDLIRRRLYMALMTALLSKMNVKNAFEQEFGSISETLRAMKNDHAVFCRFMAFCQQRSPYFRYLTTQTFWRTLETVRTEQLAAQRLH